MIVGNAPRIRQTFAEVWQVLLGLFVWDVAVTVFYYLSPFKAPSLPLTLFGSGLALFLGFRSNSSYQRWWEGRSLWGSMINASRSIARAAINFLPDEGEEARELKTLIVRRQIAYVHALRCQLRRHDPKPEVERVLGPEAAERAVAKTNVANGLLTSIGKRIAVARTSGYIDSIQQTQMEAVLVDIANAQGGMERLKNTPLPSHFRSFPDFFTRLFCVLLPIGLVETLGVATPLGSSVAGLLFLAVLRIGDDLVDPFADTVHDLPLNQMCRTIEIDLREAIGDPAPKPLQPEKGVLW